MISGLDLAIYQALFQQKKITKKYLGKVDYEWYFSEIHYNADCTVSIPFDLFDKTIVGILLVDEVLSIEEIGDILGMNIVHKPEYQQYRDEAEFDILRMALDNLYQYQMIEIGDTSYSSCRLTMIGREYAKKGRKFTVENNKHFSLIFDHTSQSHLDAKSLFENLKGKSQTSLVKDFDFLDEVLMKQIAIKQANEVYDEQKGNSFTNPKLDFNKSLSYSITLYIAILYDLETNEIQLMAYEPNTKTIIDYFSNWLNENKIHEIKEKFVMENQVNSTLKELPREYIQTLIKNQENFDHEIKTNPINVLSIVKKVNEDLDYIDIEYFWNNLKNFVSETTIEFWFFLPAPNSKSLSMIEKFAEDSPNLNVFVMINKIENFELDKKINKLLEKACQNENNLFVIQVLFEKIKNFKSWKIIDSLVEYNETIFSLGDCFYFNSLTKTITDTSTTSYIQTKEYFAKEMLPMINENVFEIIQTSIPKYDKNLTKTEIQKFENIDKKALTFNDLKMHIDILQQVNHIVEIKTEFVTTLKEKHQTQLQTELQQLITDFEKQEFSNLEPLQEYYKKRQTIQSELFEDYTDLLSGVVDFENKIKAVENRIKDEILAKTYIIDTNVFIENPDIIEKIENKHYVVLSHTVINELDKLKQKDKLKVKATKAIEILNKQLGKNKQLRTAKANTTILGEDYQQKSPDNRILSVAFMYKDKNPILLTSDNGLQLKAKSIGIPTISLKEFLGEKPEPKATLSNSNGIDYKSILEQMLPDKNGKYQISTFISILKKQNSDFDYKLLGFEKAWQFVESLGIFKVTEKQFLNLKQ